MSCPSFSIPRSATRSASAGNRMRRRSAWSRSTCLRGAPRTAIGSGHSSSRERGGSTRLLSRNRFRLPTLTAGLGMVPMEPASLVHGAEDAARDQAARRAPQLRNTKPANLSHERRPSPASRGRPTGRIRPPAGTQLLRSARRLHRCQRERDSHERSLAMKALVYHGPASRPGIRPRSVGSSADDAIVRIDTSTICGTDLHIIKGDVPGGEAGDDARPRGGRHGRRDRRGGHTMRRATACSSRASPRAGAAASARRATTASAAAAAAGSSAT